MSRARQCRRWVAQQRYLWRCREVAGGAWMRDPTNGVVRWRWYTDVNKAWERALWRRER